MGRQQGVLPARTATRAAVAHARAGDRLISFDPNLRKPLWPNDEAAKEQIEWSLHQADIVKISDEEIAFLWGLSPEEGAQKLLKEYGVQLVYATLGPRGCRFANRQGSGEVASPAGIRVADTTGAGDIFGGSAMSRLLRTGKAPAELTVGELRAITRFACCAASLSTQTRGGINSVPPESAVQALLIDFAPVSTDAPGGRIQNTCSNAAGRGTIEVLRAWPRRAAGVKPAGGRSCVP